LSARTPKDASFGELFDGLHSSVEFRGDGDNGRVSQVSVRHIEVASAMWQGVLHKFQTVSALFLLVDGRTLQVQSQNFRPLRPSSAPLDVRQELQYGERFQGSFFLPKSLLKHAALQLRLTSWYSAGNEVMIVGQNDVTPCDRIFFPTSATASPIVAELQLVKSTPKPLGENFTFVFSSKSMLSDVTR
jgi:hypothetical protein